MAEPTPHIEGFRIDGPLGGGGFSTVWVGSRELDGTSSAVKIGLTGDDLLDHRFRREADALERVGPPYAPRLYARGRLGDGRPWIAMELLKGPTLGAEIEALPGPPDLAWAAARADALLAALEVAHGRGILHRDLKPENIIIASAGEVDTAIGAPSTSSVRATLLDFGLVKETDAMARDADVELTSAGTILGTPEYMAPEQIRASPTIDARADIYAFGVILYELLTLRPPFVGDSSAVEHGHLALRPARPAELVPVPAAFEDLVLACLAKDPERRPSTVVRLRRALREARVAAGCLGEGPASRPASQADMPSSASNPLSSPSSVALASSAGASSVGSVSSARLVAEGRQPAVVLLAETNAAAPLVIATVTGRHGLVVRQRGGRYVAVFSGRDAHQPAQVALSVAEELCHRHGARAALHLASLMIRIRERGPPAVYGAAVDRPESWAPASWSGVALSPDIERLLEEAEPTPSTRAAPTSTGVAPTSTGVTLEAPVIGRADVIAALEASAAAAFDATCPGLFTLLGDDGLGKSRLAAEAVAVARRRYPDALVLTERAAQPLPGGAANETVEVLRFALDAPGMAPADVQAFCEAQLGAEIGAAVGPAVAEALGWRSLSRAEDSTRAGFGPTPGSVRGRISQRPGPPPLHRDLTRAIGEGLRQRARRAPLALILDDAHWADDVLLDALEYATLDGGGVALWVVVIAHPRFERLRGAWGTRTQRFDRVTLQPLDEAAAIQVAAELLLPAEYAPIGALRKLARWAGGNPGCLSGIVRSLKRAGHVRRRPGTGSYYLDSAAIEGLPISPAWQWIIVRQLEALPPEITACARLCAVLGVSFTRMELEGVQDALDRAGGAGTPVDAGFGLDVLVERGILRRDAGERRSFQSAVFRDAIYDMLDSGHREQIHRHALAFWRAQVDAGGAGPEQLEPLARHASACGAREEAADAYIALGDIAFSAHRHVEAERDYTAALELAAEEDAGRRARALAGRGRVRYRIHRVQEALADLSAARALSDESVAAEFLLEEATALDWVGDYEGSARRVGEALASAARSCTAHLEARLLVARGRTLLRQAQVEEAIALLEEGAERAEALGDHENRVIALVLLVTELTRVGRSADSERRVEEAIRLCEEVQDLPHLCIAIMNRVVLRTLERSLPQAAEELRRAVALAREIGNPLLERAATYNFAELLYWEDQRDEALALARRARTLEERFIEQPVPECSLLLARILTVAEQHAEARRLIGWIARSCPPDRTAPAAHAFFRMLACVLRDAPAPGELPGSGDEEVALLDPGEGNLLFVDERLEVLYWRARVAARRGLQVEASAILGQAQELVQEFPAWERRFEGVAREIEALHAGTRSA